MTPDVENLFNELVELPPDQREQYFLRHRIDDSLRREVESLLAYDLDASKGLQTPITQLASAAVPPPPRCGSYELKELIGQGGMGAVYRAIRVDGEIHQQAAVKLMHAGWSNPNLRDRFLRERQILAGLSHPHIASLLDAGRTEDNRPYFVMELVEGRPIDQYCENLPLAGKIQLFLKVCDAVSFAHSRLIVHRDLKPGNILVTAEGTPKLLDFGIAKIMDGDSETTHTSDRMVTPAYASPEQILGGVVTTTNDVYSLGAVLYKLLTGKAPHADGQATPEEQFLSMINGVVKRPREHNRDLPDDIDVVVMKALRKEPSERYRTVDEFAEDLRAFLASRPIQARQGERLYRFSKYLRRRKWTIAAAAAIVIALTGGLWIANRQREIANRRFQLVRNLSAKLFEIEHQVTPLQGSTAVRQYIAETAQTYLDQLAGEVTEPELLVEIAEGYRTVANVWARRNSANLGREQDAAAALSKGYALLQKAARAQPDNRHVLRAMAQNRIALVGIRGHGDARKLGSPTGLAPEANQLLERVSAAPDDPEDLRLAARGFSILHSALLNSGKTEESRGYLERSLAMARRYAEAKPGDGATGLLAATLRNYGTFLRYDGQLPLSLKTLQEARSLLDGVPPSPARDLEISTVEYYLGIVSGEPDSLSLGNREAAILHLERSLEILRGLMKTDPNDNNARIDFAMSGVKLARVLVPADPQRALVLFDEVFDRMHRAPANSARRKDYLTRSAAESTYALRKLGRASEARARLKRVKQEILDEEELSRAPYGPTGAIDSLMRAEAELIAESGQPKQAAELYRTILERNAQSGADPTHDLSDGLQRSLKLDRLEQLLAAAGDTTGSEKARNERRQLWLHWQQKLPGNPFVKNQLALAMR
jgi:serine/threonine protein kinase